MSDHATGRPVLASQLRAAAPATQWIAGLGPSLRQAEKMEHPLKPGIPLEVLRTPSCLWFVFRINRDIFLGIRAVFCPTGLLRVRRIRGGPGNMDWKVATGMGEYQVSANLLENEPLLLRVTVTLTPHEDVRITASPADLCVLDRRYGPFTGEARRYTCQEGNSAGQTFFAVPHGQGANIFYFQNFSALREYCHRTGAAIKGTVKGEWPEEGFALPAGERALPARESVTVSDAFVEIRQGQPHTESEAALAFIDALARIYPLLQGRDAGWYDWPGLAGKTAANLAKQKGCTRRVDGKLYVEAYVGSDYKPPESMVQGAFLVALRQYERWEGKAVPLLEKLGHAPASFYDAELRVPVRWLPGVEFTKSESSEEEVRDRMDSWYLLHTLLSFGRLAEMGMDSARKVFMDSLDTVISNARHFSYHWPVFYNQRTLEVHKAETAPGEGGEQDAGGLYIQIMLQAYNLSHREEYLQEAEACAARLDGLAFGFLYQTNNTAVGAVALARLWRATGKAIYRELGIVAVGSIFSHLWLWDLGPETLTYMALPPLHTAPYVALYEESETLAALLAFQEEMRDALPEGLALLIAEYQKHLLGRGQFYYPPELPPELPEPKPKEGILDPGLHIPLEGLGPPGDKAGTVGQAVYAAAAPFILSSHCWHRMPGVPFTLFCSYPVLEREQAGTPRQGEFRFRTGGSSILNCGIRLIPHGRARIEFLLQSGETEARVWPDRDGSGRQAEVPGNTNVCIAWHPQDN